MSKLSDQIMRDLAAAGYAEWDGEKDVYFWTATGREEYGGNWRRVENYALNLADEIKRIYGPTGMIGTPKNFGSVEISVKDLPEIMDKVAAMQARIKELEAAAENRPTFIQGTPLAAVFQTAENQFLYKTPNVAVFTDRKSAFKYLRQSCDEEQPGRAVLSLYLADNGSDIVFDEPGQPVEQHTMHGTIRRLIKWIGARVHNNAIRRQLAEELMVNAIFTFDDLHFAVYKDAAGFHFYNGTDESASFDRAEDASAAMLDFMLDREESAGLFKLSDLLFGVVMSKSKSSTDFYLYTEGDPEPDEIFPNAEEAAADLANWLYNNYKATPFGKLRDKVVVLTRQTNGDFMAALEGRDGLIGGPFRHVAPEVLKLIAGLADDDQRASFAKLFAVDNGGAAADNGDLLLLGLYMKPPTEGGYYMTGAVPAVQFNTRNSGQVMSMMRMYLENWYKNEQHYPDPNGRVTPPAPEAAEDEPRQDKLVFALYRWSDDRDGAYYSLRGSGSSLMSGPADIRVELAKLIEKEFGQRPQIGADAASNRQSDAVIAFNMANPEPAMRQIVGFYDFGDPDGKTWVVSSELPGRTGKLIFSSKPTAVERVEKTLNDYMGRDGGILIAQLRQDHSQDYSYEINGEVQRFRKTNAIYTSGNFNQRILDACRDMVIALAGWLDEMTRDKIYGDSLTIGYDTAVKPTVDRVEAQRPAPTDRFLPSVELNGVKYVWPPTSVEGLALVLSEATGKPLPECYAAIMSVSRPVKDPEVYFSGAFIQPAGGGATVYFGQIGQDFDPVKESAEADPDEDNDGDEPEFDGWPV